MASNEGIPYSSFYRCHCETSNIQGSGNQEFLTFHNNFFSQIVGKSKPPDRNVQEYYSII